MKINMERLLLKMHVCNCNKLPFLALLICAALSGCKTPAVEQVNEFDTTLPFSSKIQFKTANDFQPSLIECIAVGHFKDDSSKDDYSHLEKSKLVRAAVYGVLSAKNYKDIELNRVSYAISNAKDNPLKALNCDAMLSGSIVTFKNSSLLAYSVTTVEIMLKLENSQGQQLWQARHAANSHEGSLSLSPLSLLTGVFVATTNKEDEVAFQMIDAVTRRTLATLPDRQSLDNSEILNVISTLEQPLALTNMTEKENVVNLSSLLASGAYEDAIIEAKSLIEKNPDDASAYIIAAKASLFLEKSNDSINYALEALALESNNKEALSTAGYAYLKTNKLSLAEGAFQKIIRLDSPKSSDFHSLGLVQLARKNIDASSSSFLLAGKLSIDESNPKFLYYNLSKLKSLSASNSSAKRSYEELGSLTSKYLKRK